MSLASIACFIFIEKMTTHATVPRDSPSVATTHRQDETVARRERVQSAYGMLLGRREGDAFNREVQRRFCLLPKAASYLLAPRT